MANYTFYIYTSISTENHVYIKGRLLKGKSLKLSITDNYLVSLGKSLVRAFSNEVKNQLLSITIENQSYSIYTNHEGYFELIDELHVSPTTKASIQTTLRNEVHSKEIEFSQYKHHIPFGIISDIDDTILVTRVKSFFKINMIFNTLFLNPFKRKTIENAAAFYHKKIHNVAGNGPVIYISNSPWNMYNYLKEFLIHNEFPHGELQLRDFGMQMLRKKKPLELQNKYVEIEKMLKIFDQTNFILVGDSAEKDYDIYMLIAEKYPQRIEEILIIKSGNTKNEKRIALSIEQKSTSNIQLIENHTEALEKIQVIV